MVMGISSTPLTQAIKNCPGFPLSQAEVSSLKVLMVGVSSTILRMLALIGLMLHHPVRKADQVFEFHLLAVQVIGNSHGDRGEYPDVVVYRRADLDRRRPRHDEFYGICPVR